MKFTELFRHDIHRDIETVIRAEDMRNVSTEVTEYVITKDIQKKIENLFSHYNTNKSKNGVWISGFFGSGKSHLLKILSFVFENRECDGYKVGELFAEKIEDNELLRADILKAAEQKAESILFNIDNQSDTEAKNSESPIISIFYKVFYDHLDLCGRTRHVAEFEYSLYEKDEYGDFKKYFAEASGSKWEDRRREYYDPDVEDAIAFALGKIRNRTAEDFEGYIDRYEDNLNLSIEHFAERIKKYLDKKGKNARLNFFIDEVGQYISNNIKMMLNLQTLAESLGNATNNRVWVMVTAQEDLEATVGDQHKINSDDFSKILARFHIKIPLTNANVNEVVGIRLLKKSEPGNQFLSNFWEKEQTTIQTLLSFSSAGIQFKWYRPDAHFTGLYPFTYYQTDLFEQCIITLRDHNAFQGRSQSIGERSMLGVFQQALKLMDHKYPEVSNQLAPFDLLFDGLRDSFRGLILSQILLAERQIDNPFTIRVLKVLLMVKYFKQFKADLQNISVLLVDNSTVNFDELRSSVKQSLDLLEQQVYISRNGDFYEFLTDKEKDIQQEIKNTRVEEGIVRDILGKMIFEDVIRDNRLTVRKQNRNFPFTRRIDDVTLNRDEDITINVITPLSKDFEKEDYFSMQTMANSELMMVRLNMDPHEMDDLQLFLKTRKYINQARGQGVDAETTNILNFLEKQNAERQTQLIQKLTRALGHSTYYCGGISLDLKPSGDGRAKVMEASENLIEKAYQYLHQIREIPATEESLKKIMKQDKLGMFEGENNPLSEPETSVLNFLKLKSSQNDPASLFGLKLKFTSIPYGWPEMGLWCCLAMIYKRGLIDIRENNDYIESEAFTSGMLNTRKHDLIRIYPQEKIPEEEVTKIKDFYRELFATSCDKRSPKEIAQDVHEQLSALVAEVREMLARKEHYSFLKKLEDYLRILSDIQKSDRQKLFELNAATIDEVLNFREDHWDPICSFMKGSQRSIYDKASELMKSDTTNLHYIGEDKLDQLTERLKNDTPYLGNTMREVKELYNGIRDELKERIQEEKEKVLVVLHSELEKLRNNQYFNQLDSNDRKQMEKSLSGFQTKIEQERFIATLKGLVDEIKEKSILLINEASRILHSQRVKDGEAAEPVVEYMPISAMNVSLSIKELENEEDVEQYVDALKKELLRLVRHNKIIRL
ncbi:MAG: BREX system P-loop protein BrxC [Saprospirales bacterium]|nr:MAG: BREX system P-loop protein BrxC [Saprospirales bacterium]